MRWRQAVLITVLGVCETGAGVRHRQAVLITVQGMCETEMQRNN